ncbi:hypothetical protein [Sulfurihydrogenibium sp.]|uniref:hypothetical protein n=1 Tax=Sulfurihydrogenibium sp. TaxID=2053621 RepID=UPI00263299A3|nr:hypothetical protein [Sulfurihydrogenibium sp.]
MEILKVNSVSPDLEEEIAMYDILVYDGDKHLYEFLEEAGRFIPKHLKQKVKFCKNINYSNPVTVSLKKDGETIELTEIPDLYTLLQKINNYKKDFREINTEDVVIVNSDDKKELFDTIQQFINLGINISVYSSKELEDREKVEKFSKNLNEFDEVLDKFYKKTLISNSKKR